MDLEPSRRAGVSASKRDLRRAGVVSPEGSDERSEERHVYIISVAAELAGVHPQTLRMYERKGLLAPKRTAGNGRRYSPRDIERIRMIQELTRREGVSLSGVKLFMAMQARLDEMQRRAEELERELARRVSQASSRVADGAEIIPLRSWLAFPWEQRRRR
jgi:MerR family transcriptional regulator, heat shock protein HspR